MRAGRGSIGGARVAGQGGDDPAYARAVFTGLIQHVGRVATIEPAGAGARLAIDRRGWSHHAAAGESIAVSGCCLTCTADAPADDPLRFDVVRETLDRTTIGALHPGDPVNLEHAVRADTLMGGHFVQGHVEGVAVVRAVTDGDHAWRVEFEPPPGLMPCIAPKGSICVAGVSLTIASVTPATFAVALIPETLERTTLGAVRPGDACNVETDIIARQVVRYMELRGDDG